MDDVIFAHNVPAYIATRNEHALKVTPRVAARWGAESAVHDCLVCRGESKYSERDANNKQRRLSRSRDVTLKVSRGFSRDKYG